MAVPVSLALAVTVTLFAPAPSRVMFWLFVRVMFTSVGLSTAVMVRMPAANVALTTPAGRLRPSSGSSRGAGRRRRGRGGRPVDADMGYPRSDGEAGQKTGTRTGDRDRPANMPDDRQSVSRRRRAACRQHTPPGGPDKPAAPAGPLPEARRRGKMLAPDPHRPARRWSSHDRTVSHAPGSKAVTPRRPRWACAGCLLVAAAAVGLGARAVYRWVIAGPPAADWSENALGNIGADHPDDRRHLIRPFLVEEPDLDVLLGPVGRPDAPRRPPTWS